MKESKEIYLTLVSTLDEVDVDWFFSEEEVSEAFDGTAKQLRAERLATYYCVACSVSGESEAIAKLRGGRYTDRVEFSDPKGVFMAAFDRLTGLTVCESPERVERYGRVILGEWLNRWDEILTYKK